MTIACLLLLTTLAVPAVAAPQLSTDEPIEVVGHVELTPGAADAAARAAAADQVRWDLERRADSVVRSTRPFWMPGFVGDLISARWQRQLPADRVFRIVDGQRRENDHGSYLSYQTSLRIEVLEDRVEQTMSELRRELRNGSRKFAIGAGGTAGLWALLALAYGWLDRITRGYMPWRLRFVCCGMGIAAPGIALLFI